MTLAELAVAAFVLSLLVTAIFFIYRMGLNTWQKIDTQNELLQQVQITTQNIAREAERTTYDSVSVEPGGEALAMLSALYDNGDYAVRDDGTLEWQRYIVYYYDSASRSVLRRDVPLAPTSTVRDTPAPIEVSDPGGGVQPWSYYKSGGRPLARNIETFTAAVQPDPVRMVGISISGRKDRYGSEAPEQASLSTTVTIRNR